MDLDIELLADLCEARGVSGNEGEVRQLIDDQISPHTDETRIDNVGNLIARREGESPHIALIAHMDEVGLMVKGIDEEGYINLASVGWVDPSSVIGQRVGVNGMAGVITTSALVGGMDQETSPTIDDLILDLGVSREEVKEHVRIGDYVNLRQGRLEEVGPGDSIVAKALDDRIGCFTLIELARRLDEQIEISFVFTVQEEVGLYGSEVTSHKLHPDYAIVVDMMSHDNENESRLVGHGPCITVMDGGLIANACLNDWFTNISDDLGIHLQYEVGTSGVTDAMNFSTARGGTPTTTLGVAIKNMHTTDSMGSPVDIRELVTLLQHAIENPVTHCRV